MKQLVVIHFFLSFPTNTPLLCLTHTVSYCVCLLSLFVPHIQLSEELKQHLNQTMTDNYAQPGKEAITLAVDRLQQDVWTIFTKASEVLFGLCKTIYCTFSVWSSMVTLVIKSFSVTQSAATVCEVVLNYAEIQENKLLLALCYPLGFASSIVPKMTVEITRTEVILS